MGNPKPLPIQLGQLASQDLELLPGPDPITYRLSQRLRHVIARGLARVASEADVEVRPVLLSLLAAALRLAAGAVRLGNRSEDRPLGQPGHLTQQPLGSLDAPNRCHRLGVYTHRTGRVQRKLHDRPPLRYSRDSTDRTCGHSFAPESSYVYGFTEPAVEFGAVKPLAEFFTSQNTKIEQEQQKVVAIVNTVHGCRQAFGMVVEKLSSGTKPDELRELVT